MRATLWADDHRRTWLTLYADDARTWQPPIGSMPLAADHQIPDGMPTYAPVDIEGPAQVGGQPGVRYDDLRFRTTGPLCHPAGEPAYGVGATVSLSGRFRIRSGDFLPSGRQSVQMFVYFVAVQLIVSSVAHRGGFAFGLTVVLAMLPLVVVGWLPRLRAHIRNREATRSPHRLHAYAVPWQAVPPRSGERMPLMVSLYALDAPAGSGPLGTVRLDKAPEPALRYADRVVVRGEIRSGGIVVIEHAGRTLPAGRLRTDIAPIRGYQPPA